MPKQQQVLGRITNSRVKPKSWAAAVVTGTFNSTPVGCTSRGLLTRRRLHQALFERTVAQSAAVCVVAFLLGFGRARL